MSPSFSASAVELFESLTGIDTPNRYGVFPIKEGLPDPLPKEWLEHFKEDATPLLKGKENGECCERICCPFFRSFEMPFRKPGLDPSHKDYTAFTAVRPYKCTFHAPCCMCYPQEMAIKDQDGAVVAHAVEEFKMCWWCTRSFQAMDGQDNVLYNIRSTQCAHSKGYNCCAPSCCNHSYGIDVFDASNTQIVSTSAWVWPGWNCAGVTDRSNAVVCTQHSQGYYYMGY